MVKDHSDSEKETCCHHYMGYSFQLATRYFLLALSHPQIGWHIPWPLLILFETRNNWMGPPWWIDLRTYCTMSRHYHRATTSAKCIYKLQQMPCDNYWKKSNILNVLLQHSFPFLFITLPKEFHFLWFPSLTWNFHYTQSDC